MSGVSSRRADWTRLARPVLLHYPDRMAVRSFATQSTLPLASEFERFAAELSAHFINVPAAGTVVAIRTGLQRIGQALAIDRCMFARIDPDGELVGAITWSAPHLPQSETRSLAPARIPWTLERVLAAEMVVFSTVDDVPSQEDRTTFGALGTRSAVYIPLFVENRVAGALAFSTVSAERQWPLEVLARLTVYGGPFNHVLARQLRHETTQELNRLQDEERERSWLTSVVGQSAAMRRVLAQVEQVARTNATVLLLGETGTGKELFATRIHDLSARRGRPMVRVNCGAIPSALIESELFGREQGAFTGLLTRQIGRFELADRTTIFLDEVGDLPSEVQVKLLRVLEEAQIERLGSSRPIHTDTRVIAATHCNLEQRIGAGTFREDLHYRLNVFPILLPPLRERTEDIPLLVWRFVEDFSQAIGKRIDSIDSHSLTALQEYSWPGNVRELRNVVERAMILASSRRLIISPPSPVTIAAAARTSPRLMDVEKDHIRTVLEGTGWRIRGAGGAAERLGLKPTTLETRLTRLGLKRPGRG